MEINEFVDDLFTSEELTETETVIEEPHLFLNTPFDEYNVSEGLLLSLLLCLFISTLAKILKEGFYWLL